MNNFNRDELHLIHDGLCYAVGCSKETGGMMADLIYPIAKKIEELINNYCNHQDDNNASMRVPICQLCGRPK